jgi:hypothetical protein
VTRARILSFHIDDHDLPGLTAALDGVARMFADRPDFRGLVCLEHNGPRNEIMVMTLWDGDGLDDTQHDAEIARQRIAATTDLGVSSKCYDVIRLVPGFGTLEGILAAHNLSS